MLPDLIPAAWRKTLYLAYGLIGLTLGAIQVGYSSAGIGQPVWLTVALAVFAFLGTGLGIVAAGNVARPGAVTGLQVTDDERQMLLDERRLDGRDVATGAVPSDHTEP